METEGIRQLDDDWGAKAQVFSAALARYEVVAEEIELLQGSGAIEQDSGYLEMRIAEKERLKREFRRAGAESNAAMSRLAKARVEHRISRLPAQQRVNARWLLYEERCQKAEFFRSIQNRPRPRLWVGESYNTIRAKLQRAEKEGDAARVEMLLPKLQLAKADHENREIFYAPETQRLSEILAECREKFSGLMRKPARTVPWRKYGEVGRVRARSLIGA